jgi:sulfide:quinone oxidoreductase
MIFQLLLQIVANDIPAISNAGFKTIICNRPDGEESNQQSFSDIEAVFWYFYNLSTCHGRDVTDEDGREFERLLNSAVKPVLAYCRTGTRCTVLWC